MVSEPAVQEHEFAVDVSGARLRADLISPRLRRGPVIFVHGSGSSRHSRRNRDVASVLRQRGFATLLLDLLKGEEGLRDANRFDIDCLTQRLLDVAAWAVRSPEMRHLPIVYFGARTGAAPPLKAAARPDVDLIAVVSRGGRPELALADLPHVVAPTLLFVGDADPGVIELNRQAHAALRCPNSFEIVPGATHLFEESGAPQRVALLAADWIEMQLTLSEHDKVRTSRAES